MAVGETVADALAPLQARFDALMKDKAYLETVMKDGSERANYIARKTISKVHRKIGYIV
jgi:tryptophanyl-tRNA synthetase